jgi:uncharacterized membrane protein YdfJ with MMPL/SSD domain
MSTNLGLSKNPGVVARVARWCVEHRRRALIAWLVLLVAALAVSSAVGTRPSNQFSLNGTESQRAQDVLTRAFPAQSGDIDQIVFHARQGASRIRSSVPGSRRPSPGSGACHT